MWQKCPLCNGDGETIADGFIAGVYQECRVCKGARIISKLTGLPPDYEANEKTFKELENSKSINIGKYPLGKEQVYLDNRQIFKDSEELLKIKLNENFASK